MSGNPQEQASKSAMQTARQTAEKGYGIGLDALQEQMTFVDQGLASGGQPGYVKDAFTTQRTGVTEGLTGAERGATQANAARSKGAVAGGNVGASMGGGVPADYGAKIAKALMGSKTSQAMSGIEEMNSLMGIGLGGSAMGAGAAMSAGGAQLSAIGMLPQQSSGMTNLMALLGAGGAAYGAGSQAGWFGGGGTGTSSGEGFGGSV